MRITHKTLSSFLLFFLFYNHNPHTSLAQPPPNTTGYTCTPTTTTTTTTCQTYAFFRATAPDFLNLSAVGDLFSVSRRMISTPSNISSPTSPLIPNQSLLVPITCSCNSINSNTSLSFANLTYTIQKGDTFYYVSTFLFQNLTTFQSVMVVNPTLIPTQLEIGQIVPFPIFCKCPNRTQLQNKTNYLISYVFQPDDTIPSIASRFGSTPESILDVNGGKTKPFDTVFVPVSRTPNLTQPSIPSIPPTSPVRNEENENKGVNKGLGIGLGICGFFLVLVIGLWGYRESKWRKRKEKFEDEKRKMKGGKGIMMKDVEMNLMADVSDCLDKYKVFEFDELIEATDGFDSRCVIEGSVYKGCIDGEVYAIKKMKWNAYEELKILQKVNHGNLVKLEGFCIQKEEANCYLIYEYVENGSLHSWLHGNTKEKLSWKTRLRIAIDVANVLQYIHEHTRPRVVHKDIKSSNILLDSNMRAKIANFGLAKSGCNAITMHIVGTQGYIAPEYLTDGVVSTKMDVFSFGVVLLELISGREAIDEEGKVLWGIVDGILEGGEERKVKRLRGFMDNMLLEESCSMDSVVNVLSLAAGCLHRDPLRRPSMVDIVYTLCKSDDLFFDVSDDRFSPREVVAR